jgi:hypothetical protein
MKALYSHDVTDVSDWVTDEHNRVKYYDVVKPLAYQMLEATEDMKRLAYLELISQQISFILDDIKQLYLIDRASVTGQVLDEYMHLQGREYPYWVYADDDYMLIAAVYGYCESTNDGIKFINKVPDNWFAAMIGDDTTDKLEVYAGGRGVTFDWTRAGEKNSLTDKG